MHKQKAVVSGWGMKRARQTGWMLGLAMCVALVACVGAAKASTSVWADVGTDWHLPANWTGGVPSTNDFALFAAKPVNSPMITATQEVKGLIFRQPDATGISGSGCLRIGSGGIDATTTLTGNRYLDIGVSGDSLVVALTEDQTWTFDGPVLYARLYAKLTGPGTITLANRSGYHYVYCFNGDSDNTGGIILGPSFLLTRNDAGGMTSPFGSGPVVVENFGSLLAQYSHSLIGLPNALHFNPDGRLASYYASNAGIDRWNDTAPLVLTAAGMELKDSLATTNRAETIGALTYAGCCFVKMAPNGNNTNYHQQLTCASLVPSNATAGLWFYPSRYTDGFDRLVDAGATADAFLRGRVCVAKAAPKYGSGNATPWDLRFAKRDCSGNTGIVEADYHPATDINAAHSGGDDIFNIATDQTLNGDRAWAAIQFDGNTGKRTLDLGGYILTLRDGIIIDSRGGWSVDETYGTIKNGVIDFGTNMGIIASLRYGEILKDVSLRGTGGLLIRHANYNGYVRIHGTNNTITGGIWLQGVDSHGRVIPTLDRHAFGPPGQNVVTIENGCLDLWYMYSYLGFKIAGLAGYGGEVYTTSGARGLVISNETDHTYSGPIWDGGARTGDNASRLDVTKLGAGTQTFSGLNRYSGDTLVQQGTLAIDGRLDPNNTVAYGVPSIYYGISSTVRVKPEGTLAGSGTICGAVHVQGGGLAPGNGGVGTLTLEGPLAFTNDSSYVWEMRDPLHYDTVAANGGLTFFDTAVLDVRDISGTAFSSVDQADFPLFTFTGAAPSNPDWDIRYSGAGRWSPQSVRIEGNQVLLSMRRVPYGSVILVR